jgi:aromatic ring-opening dioxygenase LigB subunit
MGGRTKPQVPAVVVSPARDLSLPDHVRAGQALARAADASGKRVALIASADHGHAHDPDGPYGFDPAAAEYDDLIVRFVQEDRLDGVLGLDPAFVDAAKADSWWQLAMLHGALGTAWTGTFLSYEASTYFGMLCAAYAPN